MSKKLLNELYRYMKNESSMLRNGKIFGFGGEKN